MIKQPVSANTKRVYYPIETKRSTEPNIIKNENFSRTEKVRERDIDVLRRQN